MRIRPFRALRPTPAAAAAVACVPYDVVTTDAARALAADAPLSFLHVTRAEIDLGPDVDPHDPVVYATARANLARLRHEAPLVVEDEPALYVYRLRDGDHEQTGLAGCFPLDDYDGGAIRRHERTRRDKEDDRTRHMAAVEAQTGIVFLAYRRRAAIDDLVAAVSAGEPLFDFEAPDGVRHTVWRATAGQTADLVDGFAAVPALYIADGHHRAASAARARRELAGRGADGAGPAARDHFVAVAFPDRETRILPYNRTVSDLAGAGPEEFLAAVAARLPVAPADAATPGKGAVAMYVDGRWHRVGLTPAAAWQRVGPGSWCWMLRASNPGAGDSRLGAPASRTWRTGPAGAFRRWRAPAPASCGWLVDSRDPAAAFWIAARHCMDVAARAGAPTRSRTSCTDPSRRAFRRRSVHGTGELERPFDLRAMIERWRGSTRRGDHGRAARGLRRGLASSGARQVGGSSRSCLTVC